MRRRRVLKATRFFGAGLVSGAADNDPTTVATLAVIGSTTVYALSWLVVAVIPMLVVIQTVAANLGVITREGLEDSVRERYGPGLAIVVLVSVLIVNLITLAADLEGGSAALELLTGIDYRWWIVPFAALVLGLLIVGSYKWIERFLRYAALLFVTYVAAAFAAHPDWHAVLQATLVPHFDFRPAMVTGAIALLGTTLTAYAYVWETIELAEERPPRRGLALVELDAAVGIFATGIVFWFILIATAATLGVHHKPVETAQEAAQALAPLAGRYASILFGVGLLGSAIVAIPVLAGTCAYLVAEMFGWRRSLTDKFANARPFYTTLIVSVVLGVAISYAGVSPIGLLFFASIVGGIATPVTLAIMMLLARDRRVMHDHPIPVWLSVAGWIVTLVVTACSAIYLVQTFTQGGSG